MHTLLLVAAIAVSQSPAVASSSHHHSKTWHDLSNVPGWQGYGSVLPSGWIDPDRFRLKADHSVTALPGDRVDTAQAVPVAQAACAAASGSCGGFIGLLNAARAHRGLSPVAYDPYAEGVSAQNNAMQSHRGLGHWFLGGLAQCSAVGQPDPASALTAWSQSPPHAAILFSPGLRSCGYSQVGACHTASGSMGY